MATRAEIIEKNFLEFIRGWGSGTPRRKPDEPIVQGSRLTVQKARNFFESQITSRLLDYESRRLRAKNLGFYTIGSAGHEGNVVLGELLRKTDPSFLHYRSGAFMAERYRKSSSSFIEDTILSYCAAADEPTSGGRHKVWGNKELWVPPQTSTIASQLPKAVGAAFALGRAERLQISIPVPYDSIVLVSFGDASTNHSTALGAFNAAGAAAYQKLPAPVLFLCEDNGIGISVRTPKGWVETNFSSRPGIHYLFANGLNFIESYDKAFEAIELCRNERMPVFLHMKTVRLMGHAGSDVETEYLSNEEIETFESQDPLLTSAKLILENGGMTNEEVLKMYESISKKVSEASEKLSSSRRLTSLKEVTAPLASYTPAEVKKEAERKDFKFESKEKKPKHLAVLINNGLEEMLSKYPEMILFGEDVAKKGGVYHVTADLYEKFGPGRVFNTLLDEQTILGLGIGAAHLGFLPVPEIQYLAYFHNADDQIRGEAGSLQFFSNGQFKNPLVIRIASFAYQKGFGGHFHNDNAINALREIPGVVIATPARGDDAVGMLRTAMALAKVNGRVVFFLEPIALYMTKDLYETNDGLWQNAFPAPGSSIPLGEGRIYNESGKDLMILTYANGLYLSLRAAKTLKEKHKVNARILDLRWLTPLPEKQILEHAEATGKVLVVDECRKSGGVADALMALISEQKETRGVKLTRLTAADTYLPLGGAMNLALPSEEQIIESALMAVKS